jgi:uncharacterized membrane protein
VSFGFPWLVWLGFRPHGFHSIDYIPLLPWFGIFLLGIFMGDTFYGEGKRGFKFPELDNWVAGKICFIGRHSLMIYMTHQIVIIFILQIFLGIPKPF